MLGFIFSFNTRSKVFSKCLKSNSNNKSNSNTNIGRIWNRSNDEGVNCRENPQSGFVQSLLAYLLIAAWLVPAWLPFTPPCPFDERFFKIIRKEGKVGWFFPMHKDLNGICFYLIYKKKIFFKKINNLVIRIYLLIIKIKKKSQPYHCNIKI